jgi:hypothetical protein
MAAPGSECPIGSHHRDPMSLSGGRSDRSGPGPGTRNQPSPERILRPQPRSRYSSPMRYVQPLFRPPSEAHSLILQATLGCSNNHCTYCAK